MATGWREFNWYNQKSKDFIVKRVFGNACIAVQIKHSNKFYLHTQILKD
jgi:hypothetical protein